MRILDPILFGPDFPQEHILQVCKGAESRISIEGSSGEWEILKLLADYEFQQNLQ